MPAKRLTKSEIDASPVEAFSQSLAAFARNLKTRNEPMWAMQAHLLQELCAEKLEAVGIMTKPDIGREPQIIPAFIFKSKPRISWPDSTVENFGQRFDGVEVRGPTATESPTQTLKTPAAPRGRSSKVAEIEAAIDAMLDRRIDLREMTRPRAYEAVRRFARSELGIDTKRGFSDPVIQRCLVARLGKRL